MSLLDGKVAIITGASQGIGKAIAEVFVKEGARVAAFSRNREALQALYAIAPQQILPVVGDVTNTDDLKRLTLETVARFGPSLDIVVPGAGIAKFAPAASHQLFEEHFAVNTHGAINTVTHCLPYLKSGASIVYITTSMTHGGFMGLDPYISSKDALQGHMRSQAVELASQGIRVNAVAPGLINTPIWSNLGLPPEVFQQTATQIVQRLLSHKFGSADDVARLVLAVASIDHIYGQEYVIDGGYMIN